MAQRGRIKSPVTIRDFRPADGEAVVGLLQQLQSHEYPLSPRLKPPHEIGTAYLEILLDNCRKSEGSLLVAEQDADIAGCAVIYCAVEEPGHEELVAHHYALVSELIVDDRHRHTGVGQALLQACEARARAAGRDEIALAVLAANHSARDFYTRAGFTPQRIRLGKFL